MAATDADPWTFVKPRSRKNKGKQASSKPPPGSQTSSEAPAVLKPRTTNLRSVDEISVEYRAVRAEWLESDTCAKLRELVEKHASGNVSISKAICLGVGTFDPEDGAWAQKRISFHQLIAFTVMVEELEKKLGTRIQCISQDPIFTESDKGFLNTLGHQVLESPSAYAEIDENTFLYGVHLYRPVYAASFEKHLSYIFVGTGYDEWESATMGSLDDIKPMKQMEDSYTKAKFPEDPIPATFFGTSIYWRPGTPPSGTDGTKSSAGNPETAIEDAGDNLKDEQKAEDKDLVEKLASTTLNESEAT
ncbi:SRR1 domain-containing protein [Sarocladium implicatum]|nr:SRR1 domain-containing protein [Sarocladium implicatum]